MTLKIDDKVIDTSTKVNNCKMQTLPFPTRTILAKRKLEKFKQTYRRANLDSVSNLE